MPDGLTGGFDIEPEPRLGPSSEPHHAEFIAMLVDPGTRDAQLGGERRSIHEAPDVRRGAVAHELDHPQRDGLDPGGIDGGGRVQRA